MTATDDCGGCQLNIKCTYFAANSAITALGSQSLLVLNRTSRTLPYIEYHSYSITSAFFTDGSCQTTSGSAVPVEPPVLATVSNNKEPGLSLFAGSFWASQLGFTECFPNVDMITHLPTLQARITTSGALRSSTVPGSTPTVASRTNPAFASASTSNNSRGSPATSVKLIVGLLVPAIVIFALALSFCIWRRRRKSSLKKGTVIEETRDSNPQLYFQQKPELHSEQARHEMSGDDIRHELDEDCSRNELVAISARNEIAAHRDDEENATAGGSRLYRNCRDLNSVTNLLMTVCGAAVPMNNSRSPVRV